MKRLILLTIALCCVTTFTFVRGKETPSVAQGIDIEKLYNDMQLKGVVNFSAFEQAVVGYFKLAPKRMDVMTVVDFTKPSYEERLFVLDMRGGKLLYSTHVAHGKKSGDTYATQFSNVSGSNKSSLGFLLTEQPYKGRNGYSLKLEGLEKGINDKALERAIVVHGADYCEPTGADSNGRIGRSWGCLAVPWAVNQTIIDAIKGGSLVYVYADNAPYMAQSKISTYQHTELNL